MDDNVTEQPIRRVRLHPCQFCGRQFNPETLTKHQAICRNVANKKRKVFDAGKQRAADSDVPYKATKRTAQIYNGDARAYDDRSKYQRKSNWREKHSQLIQSIREARTVTRALKEGGPLPAFRPSEVPSDYTNCPYCHRNFNRHAAERHIPFCQTQHERKHGKNARPNPQYDRGRTLPPQQSPQYREQQSYNTNPHSSPHDLYNNGYKHINSAPMIIRREPQDYRQPPPPPPRKTASSGWGFRRLFGIGSKEEAAPSSSYYAPDDEDYYEQQPTRRTVQQPVLMRTGRTQENTSLNVHARQRSDDGGMYMRRVPAPQQQRQQPAPSSYGYGRPQYSNNQYSFNRPTAAGRPQQPVAIRCGDCGSIFNNVSARYCPHCGSRC